MKELKINGILYVEDDMTLQQFCEKFNEIMDKEKFAFSGGIKEIDKEKQTENS